MIDVKKFGEVLTSRPAGKEAYLSAKAYILPKNAAEAVVLDFKGVKVLSPSWADEFVTPLQREFTNVQLINTENSSVKATLETIAQFAHQRN